jgi:hypothetical protein
MIKLVHRLLSTLWGMLAGAIFKRLWKLAARKDEAPKASDADRERREILIAGAAHGATFGLVKPLIDRGTAVDTQKLTGTWPGDRKLPAASRTGRPRHS